MYDSNNDHCLCIHKGAPDSWVFHVMGWTQQANLVVYCWARCKQHRPMYRMDWITWMRRSLIILNNSAIKKIAVLILFENGSTPMSLLVKQIDVLSAHLALCTKCFTAHFDHPLEIYIFTRKNILHRWVREIG